MRQISMHLHIYAATVVSINLRGIGRRPPYLYKCQLGANTALHFFLYKWRRNRL